MDINIAQKLYEAVDASLQTTLVSGTAKVMLGLGGLFGTFWLLHMTIKSIYWLFQGMTVAFRETVIEIAKVAFIAGCAWNITWYVQTIVPFVTGLPVWMGGILSGQEGNQVNQIDSLIGSYIDSMMLLIESMSFNIVTTSFSTIYLGLQALVLYSLAGIPFILVAVGTLIVLKVATTVMLALGPIFIAFALFNQTKQWFWGWVAIIAGFMMTQVLFSIVLALEISFINTVIVKDGTIDVSLAGNIAMLVYFASFTLLATELPGYAASVLGGAPVGATGLGGIISRGTGAGAAMQAARGVGKGIDKARGFLNRNKIQ
ncbi:type IV secretion system protein [Pseudomonas kitaguniensis]|uniref:type IV secretion system protein n=1 Tax=Pseudomonas kitaguniensis TaxID=2607908 RepID=UPI003B9DE6D2